MGERNRLSYYELKKIYHSSHFKFTTTDSLKAFDGIVGQERAVKALEFGLDVKNSKYNIYISGIKGTGKTTYCISKVKEKAKKEEKKYDWCYVNNFKESDRPKRIKLPAGMGKMFREDMEYFVRDLIAEVTKTFISEDYQKRKNDILKKYQVEKKQLLDFLIQYSKELGFEISNVSTGLIFEPIKDGKKISDEEFDNLNSEEKKDYEKKAEDIQLKALEIMRKVKLLEKEAKKKLYDFQKMTAHFILKPSIEAFIDKYKDFDSVVQYIKEVEEDVIENVSDFQLIAEADIENNNDIKDFAPRYYVNIIVDNSETQGAPVVIETNPTFSNLVGVIEYESENSSLKTDFTLIKAGDIHKANGGYLIIDALELLRNPHSWLALKRALYTREIKIESLRHQLGITDITTLKPEPIPINIKVILIGNPHVYNLLYQYDEDFHKLFKIKVDFDCTMENRIENQYKMACFIKSFSEKENLRHLTKEAVFKVLEYSNKIAGSQNKLSTRFSKITEILIEADTWAGYDKNKYITDRHVKRAIKEKRKRRNKVEDRIDDLYRDGKIIIDVKGTKIGKINGLSVLNTGDYIFGRPMVITVSSYAGTKGIINIEREVELSGNIHDKGVMILEGYINEKFCKNKPLSITSKICFEQSYNGVDGDSASSTELYGILSSIGDIPIRQDIAVTGSVNQKGEIQPVGGITEKVEGFYNICKCLGMTGSQGVIIPYQNKEDLVLEDEIIEAVRNRQFHIYAISTIEEGMEILTGKNFETISNMIEKKLESYSQISSKDENSN
ncbi:Lon protease family protein [Paramaledivibacter caminithermalis]|uniref:endopeptidase La n=1 Tax=Paramaledivibacter caminithermalis (strain DSM 15212 / CIP 107654 / DViRD3) TaxID=1121301 RepID=A0A1M6MMX9_PARC5|nr:AAA family ATPase [Paramaledivibacter caminithermalis]SHJ84633.1 Lon-like ATP-dependent protease [Paramaledivibacter caminithermalis DSM 15212]